MSDTKPAVEELLESLNPFAERFARGKTKQGKFFLLCVKSSFSKCYDLCQIAHRDPVGVPSFFLVSNLRSVCEDLIVLGFIGGMERQDRETLVTGLMMNELRTKSEVQERFFQESRPFQPVIPSRAFPAGSVNSEQKIRAVWQKYGWPGLSRGTMPQTRQIAEKHHLPMLPILYDYLYRVTSGGVHFNPQALLRNGWGGKIDVTFSAEHYEPYYLSFLQVYGVMMLCLYFELLGRYIQPGPEVRQIVSDLRESIVLLPRWPEVVTFEELNLEPPPLSIWTGLGAVYQSDQTKNGFLR